MKQFTQVNNSKGLISRFLGLKSRITSTKPVLTLMLLIAFGLFGVNEKAWGASKTKLYVQVNGSGKIKVNTTNTPPADDWSSSTVTKNQSHGGFSTWVDDTYYIWVNPNTGYYCSGVSDCTWSNSGYYTVTFTGSNFTAEKTVTATFVGNSYTLTFNGNGNTNGSMTKQSFVYGTAQNIKANGFTRAYTVTYQANGGTCSTASATATYTLAGWAKSANGDVVFTPGQQLKTPTPIPEHGDVIDLFAVWNAVSVTLPTPTKDGFLFDGWYNGDTYVGKGGESYTPTAGVTLTAHWAEKLTPQFVLDKSQVELEDKAILTLTNVNNPSINISPAGIVAYNAQNGELTALSLGTVTITVTQQAVGDIKYKQEQLSLEVIRKTPSLTLYIDGEERTSKSVVQGRNAEITYDKVSDANVEISVVSGGSLAAYADGKITASEIGTAVFRATLPETDTYQSTYVEFSIKVTEDLSHLPITINSSDVYDAVNEQAKGSGDRGWDNSNGIYLGKTDSWSTGNWDDKYVTIHFVGVPDKLSFKYKYVYRSENFKTTAVPPLSSTDPNQRYYLYIEESANGSDWTPLAWQNTAPTTTEQSSGDQQLKKTTRYLRFHLHANYGAYYREIKVTELKYVQDPDPANIDLGTAVINSGEVSKTTLVNWCNVAPLAVTSSNPRFTVSPTSFGGYEDYGSQILTISYTHGSEVGAQEADITLSNRNATFDKTIHVTAETTKRPQTITWNNTLVSTGYAMNVGEQYPDASIAAVATVARGARVTYTSANSNFIEVVADTALLAKGVGKVKIAAHQAGDGEYAAVSDTVEFQVTNLLKQSITWDQDLMSLLTTSGTVELNATASSNGQITYTSGNSDVVSVSGNTLTVVGEGETTITATQAGGEIGGQTYLPISLTASVYVRNPASQCNGKALNVNSLTLSSSHLTQEYTLSGVPETLTFSAYHGTKSGQWGTAPSYASLIVEQYACINDLWDWYEVYNHVVGTSATASGNVSIDASATKIRFRTGETAVDHTISGILVSIKKFMSADVESVDLNVEANSIWQQTITVSHSNIDKMSVTTKQGLLTLSSSTLGDGCGDFGDDAFEVSYTPTNKNSEYKDTIIITDSKTVPSTIEIPVRLYAQALNQSINGFVLPTSAKTTDLINLTAEATSGLTVTYSPSDPNKAQIINNNQLIFLAAGEVTVTASQAGNAAYNAAEAIEKTIVANKVTPAIVENPEVAKIQYTGTFNNSQLSGGKATVTLRGVANTEVAGTFTWKNAGQVTDAAGSHDYSITFTPTDGGMYNPTTFTQSVTISRADGSIEMNNGNVKVKVAGINDELDEWKIDLDDLVKTKVVDAVANRAGNVTYEVISANKANAAIDGDNKFSATQAGSYTIRATQAQTDYYEEATDEFTVTVNKLTPTIVFDNTDDPQIIYSGDVIEQPAYRQYNGKFVDRNVQYVSSDMSDQGAIYVGGTTLTARNVTAPEGSAVEVTITASTTENALYNAAELTVTHNYAVRAKRSPVFTMEGVENAPVSKTLNIGETAIITYNEFTNEFLTIGTASEHSYVSYVHEPANRRVIVTAVKGTIVGDGVQEIIVDQPGNDYLFPRDITYTFTVKRNVSALSLTGLTTAMNVEDTVATPYTGLANTAEDVQFSCSPEGSMKYENGKLIALQAGTNTVTFSQPATEYWTGISQSKTITVSKKDPNMTTELSNRHAWYSIIEHPFKSLNTEKPFTIESSNETLAKYIKEEDKIYVYGTSGNVTFTVNQDANYKYNAVVNYQKTFTIFQPNNRLPFTLTSGNLEDYNGGGSGSISWNGGGVVVGSTSTLAGPGGWKAKSIILKFVGVPNKLSFDFENTSGIATQYGWHFYQSSNGSDWNLIKEYQDALMNSTGGTSEGTESNLQLDPATQYIKLEYHGNYGGRFKNVHVTERKEIAPRDATKDFGLGYNGNDPTMRAITVDWYNVKPCTVTITGTDADKFVLDEGSKTINSQLDHYGSVNLMVSYKHETNSETTHTATLHIEDADGKYADVTLTGQTTPAPQTIIWRSDLTPMPIEGSFQNAAMVTTGQAVTLVSDHPEIVRVVNNTTLEPVSAGTAHVTATAAGNTKWAETTDFMDIEVTTLKVQYITWTDNLSNRKREEGQTVEIELTATSSADLPITYELDKDAQAFASISGNVLSLTGWGNGQVIAKQVGTEEYVAVQATKGLVSRNPNAKCRPLVGEYKDEYTLHTLAVKEIPIYGEADSVTFWAKCDASALWGMWVAEEYDGSYHDVQEISRLGDPNITSNYQHYSFPLHRNATAVKLYTKTGATMTRTFKEVEVVLAKYLELAENTMNFSQVDKGSTKTQSFYINYSNLSGVLDVEMENKENTQFTVVTTTVGEDCGDIGQNVRIEISCTGSTLGTENNKIIISNKDQRLEIPVSATVVLPSQTITWEPAVNVLTTDEVVLSATATSELPVSFTSGNTDIADVVYEGGVYSLDIKSYGDVEITAHQAGNEDWSAATDKTLTFHISRVVPGVTTWPTAQVILPNTVGGATLNGGVAPGGIAGSFQWEDESQTVTREAHTFNVVFVPNNTNYYETVSHALEIEILKTPQTITWSRANESEEGCSDIVILDATASSGLPITYHSSDSTKAYAIDAVINEVAVKKLYILKGGDVTITAVQPGDETFAAAPSVSKTITLIRVLPIIETLPTATDMFVHHFLSNSTPQGGVVKAGANTVTGVFNWANGEELMDEPGSNQRTVVFHPYNSDYYQEVSAVINVEVQRFAPTIIHNFTTETKVYGTKLSEFTINGSGKGYDYTDPANYEIEGTFAWKDENHIPSVSDAYATMVFHPTHTEWYDDVEFNVPITITKATIISATATASMFYGQVLGDAVLTNTTTGIVNNAIGVVAGTVTWDSSLDLMEYYALGTHENLPIRFTPTDPNYEPVEIDGTAVLTVNAGYVFDGTVSTNWEEDANWRDNEAPVGNEKVVILADVDVAGAVSVDAMTIKEGVTVTVKDGAALTIGDGDSYIRSAYGNLHVENGGQVILGEGQLQVNDFVLDAKLGDLDNVGKSGQVQNPATLVINGNAYFDLALDPSGECSQGWYDFTVPFPVDALNGVTRFDNSTHEEKTIRNEVNYAIMDFSESRRLASGYGWKKFRSVMQPGQCYTITIDDVDNVYRFKKTADGAFNNQTIAPLAYTEVEDNGRGWNGLGNGTMSYINLSATDIEKVQVYSHVTNSYTAVPMDTFTYVVGSAYFVQAPSISSVMNYTHGGDTHILHAPAREVRTVNEFTLALTTEDSRVNDRFYISASEDATDTYRIGRELTKFGTPTDSKVAQVWTNAYGMQLCDVEMPLQSNKASTNLSLYAPLAGIYTLEIEKAPADATLYLTQNNRVIWNLTMSPYDFDLTKGTTEGYGLRIVAQTPQVTTDFEQSEFSDQPSVRKVLIDNVLYIVTPEGKMYDIVGKGVNF